MIWDTFFGISVPFLGTALGAACVFFMKKEPSSGLRRALNGFAAGVMTAASVWSLLLPAIERSQHLGAFAFFPAVSGFWAGAAFLILTGKAVTSVNARAGKANGASGTVMTVLAITLHNIPEGMAVGAVYAGLLSASAHINAAGAFALALGIAIQNFPEGAIVSMPLRAEGKTKSVSFAGGALSGAVEPVAAVVTLLAAGLMIPAMPYLLSFAAGAMIYAVVCELIPETVSKNGSAAGIAAFSAGFTVMMALDVALG